VRLKYSSLSEDLIVVVERRIERRASESQRQVGAIERMGGEIKVIG
jgi:hypothetical protein